MTIPMNTCDRVAANRNIQLALFFSIESLNGVTAMSTIVVARAPTNENIVTDSIK